MYGTELAYGATRLTVLGMLLRLVCTAIGLHACYAMRGTEIAYAAMGCAVLWCMLLCVVRY
eukprot:3933990-Rhodomonas_salina.5